MAENPYVLPHVLSPASMRGAGRSPAWAYGAVLAVVFLAALPFGFGLFGPSNLHAGHDEAFGGESLLLGLHVVSDALIGVAYVAISGVLIYLVPGPPGGAEHPVPLGLRRLRDLHRCLRADPLRRGCHRLGADLLADWRHQVRHCGRLGRNGAGYPSPRPQGAHLGRFRACLRRATAATPRDE